VPAKSPELDETEFETDRALMTTNHNRHSTLEGKHRDLADFPQNRHENQSRPDVDTNDLCQTLFEESSEMTSSAAAIRTEIHELIDRQIQVFGQPAPLTTLELEDCRLRVERIKSLGRELDQVSIAAGQQEGLPKVS
jgi:hypothetical protein